MSSATEQGPKGIKALEVSPLKDGFPNDLPPVKGTKGISIYNGPGGFIEERTIEISKRPRTMDVSAGIG